MVTRKQVGFCMRCRAERDMVNPHEIRMANGRPATVGACPVCQTKMQVFGKPK